MFYPEYMVRVGTDVMRLRSIGGSKTVTICACVLCNHLMLLCNIMLSGRFALLYLMLDIDVCVFLFLFDC